MIGVKANASDLAIAAELFELFKTPWEPAAAGRRYDVVVSAGGSVLGLDAGLILLYGSSPLPFDRDAGAVVRTIDRFAVANRANSSIPIYGGLATFSNVSDAAGLTFDGGAVDYRRTSNDSVVWRLGYDLLGEVRTLLTRGQPADQATTPTLELHVELLRDIFDQSGVPFVEIPAHPHASPFICCLTHDVDFFGLRRLRFDRTLAGFVARASIGSVIDGLRGRRSATEVGRNLAAVVWLPLVLAGMRKDFWRPFEDYAAVENRRTSTFFLVPFKDRPGIAPDGRTDAARAVTYQASDVRDEAREAAAAGSEIAVHGIDSWRDCAAGREELAEVTAITGRASAGVRMHWLYYTPESPRQLELAGFSYDSTWGYNDTIGYRAGTSQVFRLPGTDDLMELPLAIMDSALLSARRMALAPDAAMARCREVIANARMFGGTIVVNWHCRSLAPERLWGRIYRELISELGAGGQTWFATAGEAVEWFRWRRSIRFRLSGEDAETLEVLAPATAGPAAVVRVHTPGSQRVNVQEYPIDGKVPITVRLPNSVRHYV